MKKTDKDIEKGAIELILLFSNTKKLTKLKKVFNNPNRKEIYDLISHEKLNITQIAEKINLSYKNTFFHIKYLKELGLVNTEKMQKSQGREVIVNKSNKDIEQIKKEIILKLIKNK